MTNPVDPSVVAIEKPEVKPHGLPDSQPPPRNCGASSPTGWQSGLGFPRSKRSPR